MAAGKTYTERLTTWLSLEGVPAYVSGMGSAAAATKGMAYQQMMLYMAQQRYAQQMVMTGAAILGVGVLALKAASDFEQYRAMIYAVTRDQGEANRVFEDAIDIGMRMPGSTKEVIRAGAEFANYAEITGMATLAQKSFMQGAVDLATVFRGAEMNIDPHRMSMAIISFLGGRVEMLRRLGLSLSVLQQFGYKTDMGPAERLNVILRVMEKYSGAAGLQMKTLAGAMSNFWDVTQQVAASLMSPLLPAFTTAVRVAESFGKAIMWLPGPVKALIGATGLLAGSTAVLTGTIIALRAAYHIALQEMTLWTAATGAATGAQAGLAGATGIGGIAAAGAATSRNIGLGAGLMRVTGLDWLLTRAKAAGKFAAHEPLHLFSRRGLPGVASGQAGWLAQEAAIAARASQLSGFPLAGRISGFERAIGGGPGRTSLAMSQMGMILPGMQAAPAAGKATVGILSSIYGFLGPYGLLAIGVGAVGIGFLKWRENIEKARLKIEETAQAAFKMAREAGAAFRQVMQGTIGAGEYGAQLKKLADRGEALRVAREQEATFAEIGIRTAAGNAAVRAWAKEQGEIYLGGATIKTAEAGYRQALHWRTMAAQENVRAEEIRTEEMRQKYLKGGATGGGDDLFSKLARKVIGGGSEFERAISPLAAFKATGVLPWAQPKKAVVIKIELSPELVGKTIDDAGQFAIQFVQQAVQG